jgi:ABC-type transporter Mla subunit MlaD
MDVWRILSELLNRYLIAGFPFFLLHLFVALLIVFQTYFYRIRREIRALMRWVPESSTEGGMSSSAKTTRHLDQFVGECRVLGQRGFCVPMTDCSDRLDSILDGLIGELHDRSNLFVIIGVAGTLYGLAEYALLGEVSSQPAAEVGRLTKAMSKAFPVGFVGLILTLVFQVWAARPEGKLRVALAEATGKALRFRRDHLENQAGAIREVVGELASSLAPLRDVGGTLRHEMEALAGLLGTQFERSLVSIREQADLFSESGKVLREGVTSLSAGVAALVAVSERLDQTMKEAPQILDGLAKSQVKLDAAAAGAEERSRREELLVADVANALSSAATTIADLSTRVEAIARTSLEATQAGAMEAWREGTDRFIRSAEQEYASFQARVIEDARPLREELQRAASAWMLVAQNAIEILCQPLLQTFEQARSEIRTDLRDFLRVGTEVLPDLAERVERLREQTATTVSALKEHQEGVATWLNSIQDAETHSREIARVLSDALHRMRETLTSLSAKPLQGIGERLDLIMSELGTDGTSRQRILSQLDALAKGLGGATTKSPTILACKALLDLIDDILGREIVKRPT